MRFHFDPTPEQRAALEAQLARLQQPAAALELLDPILPDGLAPAAAVCTLQSVHSDRFVLQVRVRSRDRKSTRLNSSHLVISYAVFCLKKKKKTSIESCRNCNT